MTDLKPDTERKQFIALLLLCIVFVTLPFVLVRFIPSTDLPQHLAQIRLLQDILKNPNQSEYMVEWLGANTLVYYVIGFNWMIFEPILAGKMAVLEISLAWVISIFALARHKQRSIFSAALACVFIFNASLYWGFLNFLIGLPVFTLWYLLVVNNRKIHSNVMVFILMALLSFFLFLAHTLWLLIAVIHVIVATIRQRPTLKEIGIRCIALIPVGIYSTLWFPKLTAVRTALGFDTTAYWIVSPLERIQPKWLLESMLGGLHGPTEALIIGSIIIWVGLIIKTNWGQLRVHVDKEFLSIGTFLILVVLLAPEKYMNTLYFGSRWAPVAMILFLLALPLPRIPGPIIVTIAILPIVILSFTTCYYWYRFNTIENSGLEESLKMITDDKRVLGLDYMQTSELIYGRPFLQTFAYAQVLHGGKLNFSFAYHHSGIVSFIRTEGAHRWTPGLEWYAQRVVPNDFYKFDYALINGSVNVHRLFTSEPELKPLTTDGRWRVYQCMRDTTSLKQNNQSAAP